MKTLRISRLRRWRFEQNCSVFPDYLVCLEDGAKVKMLKRYLKLRFDLTPEQYRERWVLPRDYPMVAPSYAARRSTIAKQLGLGRKPAAVVEPEPAPHAKKRGRSESASRRGTGHASGGVHRGVTF